MDRRQWLERVEQELAGLPAGVRGRLLAELRDHFDDLTEGGDMNVELRMGDPATVAAAVERRGWAGRHPALVFGLAPVPAMLVAVACYALVLAGLGYALGAEDGPPPAWVRTPADVLLYGIAFVPFLAVAVVTGWLAVRSRTRWWWVGVALAQVALVAGLVTVGSTWSDLPGQSTLMVGLTAPLNGWRQPVQMLLPLALGLLAVWRGRRVVVA